MRSECRFGTKCYRRNENHFIEFSHPWVEDVAQKINAGDIDEVIALGLEPVLLEQSQRVAELLSSGQLNLTVPSSAKRNRESSPPVEIVDPPNKRSKNAVQATDIDQGQDGHAASTSVPDVVECGQVDDAKGPASVADRVDSTNRCNYFLSSLTAVPETRHRPHCLTFADTLDPSLGKLQSSVQFNFMVELGWLLAQYCRYHLQRKPLLVVHGEDSDELRQAPQLVPTMRTVRVKPKFPFGSHHTKMALLGYEDGSLRVVVHTGNLIESDWENRTQGLWISPRCPTDGPPADSATGFRKDLVRYLEAYSVPELRPWIDKIRKSNMSAINVFLVPSVPASHRDHDAALWGHPHLASLLREHAVVEDSTDGQIVVQCSSIGSLGATALHWLQGELGYSMAASHGSAVPQFPCIKVVYPCYEDVASSVDGLLGGGCLPYSKQGHAKQPWLQSFLHQWRSEGVGRSRCMPHIKSYVRLSQDLERASWFVLTSANLSKAAWGLKTKSNSLMIQSFEVGVLFLPKYVLNGKKSFVLGQDLHLPYDIPLTRYGPKDVPWFMDNLR